MNAHGGRAAAPAVHSVARPSVRAWLTAVMSQDGPRTERERLLCNALAFHMLQGPEVGCYPSRRRLAMMIGRKEHRTIAPAIESLKCEGWINVQEIPRQGGNTGYRYFPSIPARIGGTQHSPIQHRYGEFDQSMRATTHIGDSALRFGESRPLIGETRIPLKSLTETNVKGATSPASTQARSVAPSDPELVAAVRRLSADGSSAELIAKRLRQRGFPDINTSMVERTLAEFRAIESEVAQ